MTLVKRRPNEFNSFLNDFFNHGMIERRENTLSQNRNYLPKVNILETEDDFQINLAAPGMKKNEFSVSLDNDLLTISAEKADEKTESNHTFTRFEFDYQNFERSFTLPIEKVDSEKINAKYEDGILYLVPLRKH